MLYILGVFLFVIWIGIFGPMLLMALLRTFAKLEAERKALTQENLAHPDMANDPYDGYHAGNFYWW